jgi:hypothetical protein
VGVALVLVALLAGVGIAWLIYVQTYQPWQRGNIGQSQGNQIVGITDGVNETGLVDTAPTGQLAWYGMTVRLAGSHPATIVGGLPDNGPGDITLKWQVSAAGHMALSPSTATTRPTVVHAGDLVTLWIVARRPSCQPHAGESVDRVSFQWEAFGVHHVYTLPIGFLSQPTPLYLCYPSTALAHLFHA